MIADNLLHDVENNEASQNHLKDNGEKFNNHCIQVLRLLYQGKRLNARQLETEYGYDGRRLRDLAANRKDIKKQWIRGNDGKTKFVEYWLEIPSPPTKQDLQEWFNEYLEEKGKVILMQPKFNFK